MSQTFGPIPGDQRDDDALRRVARLPALAFGYPIDETLPWYRDQVGIDNLRIATRPGADGTPEVVAALGQVPMGLYVAGNEVPQLGVLGVAVPPEQRGGGAASALMRDALVAMHSDRVPLSVLYSALHPLYRRVGFELAGVLCDATVPASLFPRDLPTTDPTNRWQPATEDDLGDIKDCHRRYARPINGMLARTDYIWNRIRERFGDATPFLRRDDTGAVDAYCFLVQKKWTEPIETTGSAAGAAMAVTDVAWTSPDGLAALCRLLHGYTSMVGKVELTLPPTSPILTALPDWRYTLTVRNTYLVRVVDVEAALLARGYPAATSGSITLDLTDDTIDANTGPWTLTLTNGTPAVTRDTPASDPTIRLNVRDLAPLYTGYATPHALRSAGRAQCDDETADLAAALFATPGIPAMTDMF